MGLLSRLENYGKKEKATQQPTVVIKKEITEPPKKKVEQKTEEREILFGKTYECPVCYQSFKNLTVRTGKVHSLGQDVDLRPRYRDVDPLKYDVVACPHCGYAALSRYFQQMMPVQRKWIKEGLQEYKETEYSTELYSYNDAVYRYKLAILSDQVGKVHSSRKAYTWVKLAWVIRGRLQLEDAQLTDSMKQSLHEEEQEYLQRAYDGYLDAFSSEHFPMSGMDEITFTYLVSAIAYELGKFDEALRLLSHILGNTTVTPRIKDKALDLKMQIREAAAQQG
jgi:hypothetical protein